MPESTKNPDMPKMDNIELETGDLMIKDFSEDTGRYIISDIWFNPHNYR